MTQEEKDKLEGLINKYSISTVLEALTSICYGKAEFIHMLDGVENGYKGQKWNNNGDALIQVIPLLEGVED